MARQSLGALRRQARERPGTKASDAAGRPTATAPTATATTATASAASTATATATAPASSPSAMPTRDELVQAWGDGLLTSLSNRARARFRVGRFLAVENGAAVFALPNDTHRSYCEEVRIEVEQMLGSRFGTAVPLRLVVDEEATPASVGAPPRPSRAAAGERAAPDAPADAPPEDLSALLDPVVLAAETEPAGTGLTPEQRLKQVFPGAEEL
jgi:hypothetical protein